MSGWMKKHTISSNQGREERLISSGGMRELPGAAKE